jgi:uncharacterized membrane protein YdjX (TVP38/TMEM64 family)
MSGVRAHPTQLLGAAAALGVANWVGIALAPSLLSYSPLLLIALSPIPRHVVLAATATPLLAFVLVGTARRMLASLLGFYIARWYGISGVTVVKARYPKVAPFIAWLERVFDRAGAVLLFISPGALVSAVAGAAGMRPSLFIPVATAAHAFWMVVTYKIGKALSAWLAPIMQFIDQHKLTLTLACVALVLVYTLKRRRRQADVVEELSHPVPATPAPPPAALPPGES